MVQKKIIEISGAVTKYAAGVTTETLTSKDAGEAVAKVIKETLTLGVDLFVILSGKRAQELFDDENFTQAVIEQVKVSDDFASFTYDTWQRYNFESHARRRAMLKSFLKKEANKTSHEFQNFTMINEIIQNISFDEISFLKIFYTRSDEVQKTYTGINAGKVPQYSMEMIYRDLQKEKGLEADRRLQRCVNQLSNRGLIDVDYRGELGPWKGPWFAINTLGKIVLEIIES